MSYLILGLSGKATAGKDTFYNLLKEEMSDYDVYRSSIGDLLKTDLNNLSYFAKNKIDFKNLNSEQKEELRPLMVEYASFVRKHSHGKYFLETIDKQIYETVKSRNTKSILYPYTKPLIICITDVRFDEYEADEVQWIKNIHNGKLIYIDRYDLVYGNRVPIAYVNETEKEQMPRIKEKADEIVEWPTVTDERISALREYVKPVAVKVHQWYSRMNYANN